ATYFCTHTLTEADARAGLYANTALVEGAPQDCGEGWLCRSLRRESNTVVAIVAPPAPAFTIEKLERIAGSFTTATLSGKVGQTVEYEIVVTDTGDTLLSLSNFTDGRCDPGTIAGGPGAKALAPGESTKYTCTHVLTNADQIAGRYENVAGDTGA